MSKSHTRMLAVTVLALAMPFAGGCNSQLKKERNALYLQNQELQQRLNECNKARDAALAEADRMRGDVSRLQGELMSRPATVAVPTPAPAPAASGFEGIEGIEAIRSRGRITVRVPGDILFASGKIDLKTTALSTLDRIASVIQTDYAGKTIRVLGYTDTDPIKKSKWTDNLELSLERSAAVHRHLQKRGIQGASLEAVGKGEWHPRQTKALSRRVEIVVVLNE